MLSASSSAECGFLDAATPAEVPRPPASSEPIKTDVMRRQERDLLEWSPSEELK